MDLKAQLKKLDSKNVYGSIQSLADQIEQAEEDCKEINFPENFRQADLLAISGMGASIYSYHVLTSLFKDNLKKPLLKINDYQLAKCINEKTLFIGSSYSGDTEETLETTSKALSITNKVSAITTGGKLSEMMDTKNLPYYKVNPKFNTSGQPRVGVGYLLFGAIFILKNLKFIDFDQDSLKLALTKLREKDQEIQSKAEGVAQKLLENLITIVGAEHLAGNAHIMRNQINETAKTFSDYHLIPEMNHHLLEGLKYPKGKKMHFIFLSSSKFENKNLKRFEITQEVLTKQNLEYSTISFDCQTKIEEFIFFLQFGSYLSLFLGLHYDQDPSLIPYVDYFKRRLKEVK